MNFDGMRVISPLHFSDEPWNEAEVLGGFVWLWGLHSYYQQASIEAALNILTPVLRSRKFCFFVKDNRPLGYVNWNHLDEQDEYDYIHKIKPYEHFINLAHPAGKSTNLWMLSCFFPAGGGAEVKTILRRYIFRDQQINFLYHKTPQDKVLVKSFSGFEFNKFSDQSGLKTELNDEQNLHQQMELRARRMGGLL